MADKEQDAADQKPGSASATTPAASASAEPAPDAAAANSANEPATGDMLDSLKPQRVSGILKAVLEEEMPSEAEAKRLHYPWFVDVILGVGLLVAVGGFFFGLFKMYVTHKAQQCIIQGDYRAAIGLLKGNPMPSFISVMGTRDEDPDQLMARALYLDAMKRISDQHDLKGALLELQQIRAGTPEFEQSQKMLLENFEPSDTTLTGGVVHNEATAAGTSK